MGIQIMGKNAARDGVIKHLLNCFNLIAFFQSAEIGNFTPAKKLDALKGKVFVKTHYGAYGAVQIGNANLSAQSLSAADAVQIKGIVFFKINVNQVKNCKEFIRHDLILAEKRGSINEGKPGSHVYF
jgi:hypothetical protein